HFLDCCITWLRDSRCHSVFCVKSRPVSQIIFSLCYHVFFVFVLCLFSHLFLCQTPHALPLCVCVCVCVCVRGWHYELYSCVVCVTRRPALERVLVGPETSSRKSPGWP